MLIVAALLCCGDGAFPVDVAFPDVSVQRGILSYTMAYGLAGGFAAADFDDDGTPDATDCFSTSLGVCSVPGEVAGLTLSRDPGETTLTWSAPAEPGGIVVAYGTFVSSSAVDLVSAT